MKTEQIILGAAVVLAVVLVAKKSGVLDKVRVSGMALPSLDSEYDFVANPGAYMSVADLMDSATGATYDDIPTWTQTVDAVIGTYDREHKFGPRVQAPW